MELLSKFSVKNKNIYLNNIKPCDVLIVGWDGCLANVEGIYEQTIEDILNEVLYTFGKNVVKVSDLKYTLAFRKKDVKSLAVTLHHMYGQGCDARLFVDVFVEKFTELFEDRIKTRNISLDKSIVRLMNRAYKSGKKVYVFTTEPNMAKNIKQILFKNIVSFNGVWSNDKSLRASNLIIHELEDVFSIGSPQKVCIIDDSKMLKDCEEYGYNVIGVRSRFSSFDVCWLDEANIIKSVF